LISWTPISIALFASMPARRAALLSIVIGHLFLPQAMIDLPGMVDLSKPNVIGLGVLLGMVLFDSGRLSGAHPRWFDLPVVLWVLSPLASALDNGLGAFDGLSGVATSMLEVGVPYFAGRMYFRTASDLQAGATMLVAGGLLYAPLCWFEIRMSPVLHSYAYGFHQHQFAQSMRFGGWRPTVFLQHGLAVGMWLASAAVAAYGLSRFRRLPRMSGLSPLTIVVLLLITVMACKSVGSIGLLIAGVATLWHVRRSGKPTLVWILVAVAPIYLVTRLTTDFTPDTLTALIHEFNPDRAGSLTTRVDAEFQVRDRALEKPLFGWGGWGRFREGLSVVATDSLWSIALGQRGLVGLLGMFGMLVLAQVLSLRRLQPLRGSLDTTPPVTTLVAVTALYTLDCMVNAHLNPMYFLFAGGLIAFLPPESSHRPARRG
jgi:hypothetical protein